MATNKKIRVVELFAGVGGFRVGFERVAPHIYDTIWANQWEPGQAGQWAYKCYIERFGDNANCVNEDIETVIHQVPEHELLVGGFPCQDYSVASTGAQGIVGKKGVLWWSIDNVIKKCHPPYVLLENVDRLLKSPAKQRGRDFGIILKCLYDEGYAVEWRVINAADYGKVQRRRRTFIFAYHNSTKFYHRQKNQIFGVGAHNWLTKESLFAKAFPVCDNRMAEKKPTCISLADYPNLLEITDFFKADFFNSGLMFEGKVFSEELIPNYNGKREILADIISRSPVEEKYFIPQDQMAKWEYMKGAKRIERTSKDGYTYTFSEGPIAFPDYLDRPARTMLTSEGTANRSSHIIADYTTGRYRRLTPEECERINGFDTGWTNTNMPERQRYFIMGNALVVPVIERIGEVLLEII